MTHGSENDAPRYRIKQLTYGLSLGKWVVVDGRTVAFDPVKKNDRSMWTGTEEAAAHYADQLNKGEKKKPQPMSASQVYVCGPPVKQKRKTVQSTVPFVKCECGVMTKKGKEHTCRTK